MLGDEVRRLDGPGHVGPDDVSVGQPKLRQPSPGAAGLAASEVGEVPLGVRLAVQVVLAVPHEDQVSASPGFADLVVILVRPAELGGVSLVPVVIPLGPVPLIIPRLGLAITLSCLCH